MDNYDWNDYLPYAEFAYNNSISKSTGYSPFYMNYGRNPESTSLIRNEFMVNEEVESFLNRMKNIISDAKDKLLKAQERQEKFYNTKRTEYEFNIGDKVWLSTENISLKNNKNEKHGPRWIRECALQSAKV